MNFYAHRLYFNKKKSVNGMKCSNGSSAQQFAYMAYVSIALAAK